MSRPFTRTMTTQETDALNAAYDEYLGASRKCESVEALEAAWNEYVAYRGEHGIISTLAGYRVLLRTERGL